MTAFLTLCLAHFDSDQYGAPKTRRRPLNTRLAVEREVVGLVAEQREPARLRHDEIEHVAVHDQIAPAVGGLVHGMLDHLDAAEMRAVIAAQEFVVVAGDVDEPRALARLAQQLLHDVVVRLRPVPGRAQRPAVDDVADEIEGVGVVPAQEVEELVGLAAARAEMHVGDEKRAISLRGEIRHDAILFGMLIMCRGI